MKEESQPTYIASWLLMFLDVLFHLLLSRQYRWFSLAYDGDRRNCIFTKLVSDALGSPLRTKVIRLAKSPNHNEKNV